MFSTTPDNTVIHISKDLRDRINHLKLILGCTQEKAIDHAMDVMIEHGVLPNGIPIKNLLNKLMKLEKGETNEREREV